MGEMYWLEFLKSGSTYGGWTLTELIQRKGIEGLLDEFECWLIREKGLK